MKRYDIYPHHGYPSDVDVVADTHGEWVDADIAQELYDMLKYVMMEMEYNPILEADIQDVLEKANKG